MSQRVIAIGSDHAGFTLKEELSQTLAADGFAVLDLGTDGPASVDYSDLAAAVAGAVTPGRAEQAVLMCGTGIGLAMDANRNQAAREPLGTYTHLPRLERQHTTANNPGIDINSE